jgi:GTP cyclohydrolase I
MTELTLVCNYTKCKVLVTNFACATKCFHIFCLNHAIQGEKTNRRCHACGTILDGDFDVYQTNLSPTDDITSVCLCLHHLYLISTMEIISYKIKTLCFLGTFNV